MNAYPKLKADIAALFNTQYFAVLAIRAGDAVHTSLVAVAAAEDLKTVFLCTPRVSRKYAYLKQHPMVSLLIHNSTNHPTDTEQAIAVTVAGHAHEVPDTERAQAKATYLDRQPHLHAFVEAPGTAMIKITVNRCEVVARFQDVTILDIQNDRILDTMAPS